jgi:5-methylcytosine-specific restriction enzyme subunit McrC
MINLFEYQNKAPFPGEHFENLEEFLDDIWNKREKSSYYNEDENREEVQHFLQFLHKTNQLKSNKYVGVIHFENQTLNLLPKIFHDASKKTTEEDVKVINTHVLWWLSYCRKLKFPNYQTGLGNEQADFFEILIYLFSKYTKELLGSSIYQKYIEVESELSFIKGRIDFNSYINNNLSRGRNHKVSCVYDSFEMDNNFNQCIKQVTKLLASATKDSQNKRNLYDILFLLDEVSDVVIPAEECKRILFNPMFASFDTVRDYCVLFLENSVSFNYKNSLKLFAFLLPMEYVFEDFIFGFIDKEIDEVKPYGQVKDTFLDTEKKFNLRPDLVLQAGNNKFIADTKYKMVYADENDSKKGISQNDLYQMVAYAIRFKTTNIKLFYPKTIHSNGMTNVNSIHIEDKFSPDESINIEAYQLSIIDKNITSKSLKEHKLLLDNFEDLKSKLKEELKSILLDN